MSKEFRVASLESSLCQVPHISAEPLISQTESKCIKNSLISFANGLP